MSFVRLTTVAVLASAITVAATAPSHALNPFARAGFDLNDSDFRLLRAAAESLYAPEVEAGTVKDWNNTDTGNYGTVTLVKKHAHNAMPCLRLQHDIRLRRNADPFRFIIDRCKTPDGVWKLL